MYVKSGARLSSHRFALDMQTAFRYSGSLSPKKIAIWA